MYKHYRFGAIIGDVTVSKARIAVHKKTGKEKAVKIYDKSLIPNLEAYMETVDLLGTLDHPNVLKYDEVYEDKDYLYFIADYMRGGELYDAIIARGNYNEHDSAYIVRQLLQAVAYLHADGIVHRNIRPGNILLANQKSLELKLIDYDFASVKPAGVSYFTPQEGGNPVYEAPEVLNNSYNEKCDIWSIGVIFYYLLSGELPFMGDSY